MTANYCLLLVAAGLLSAKHAPRPQRPHRRVIGGFSVEIEKAPWQVSVHVNGSHHCGGSIYSENVIIIAAHCFYKDRRPWGAYRLLDATELLVFAGSKYKRYSDTVNTVERIMHHEKYNHSTDRWVFSEYNIGVMHLRKYFRFSSKIGSINLATRNPAIGSVGSVTGWGDVRLNLPNDPRNYQFSPEILQGSSVQIESQDCKSYQYLKKNGIICAGTAGVRACNIDEGGPLVYDNTLVGVSIDRVALCQGPPFYVSVAYHYNWLIDACHLIY